MKTCTLCSKTKPKDEFYLSITSTDGIQGRCKECQNRRRYGDNFRGGHVNMSDVEFFFRFVGQSGQCASCEHDLEMSCHIDHDHSCCGKNRSCQKCRRGLLCRACNVSLGILHEDPHKIRKLADYADRIRRN